jgi:hypothetical protein
MAELDHRAEGVHFVVRHHGQLHVTNDSYVYNPHAPALTAEERDAIRYLEEILSNRDVALLDDSTLRNGNGSGWKVVPPHHRP